MKKRIKVEIPIKIRRRVPELEKELDDIFINNPHVVTSVSKEVFIKNLIRTITHYLVLNCDSEIDYYELIKRADTYNPYIELIFKDKLILHWEKQNGK
jgi:hypothetical protein